MIWPFFITAGSWMYHYLFSLLRLGSLLSLGMLALVLFAAAPTVPVRHVVLFETVPVQRQVDQIGGKVDALDKRVNDLEALQMETALAKIQQSLDDQRYLVFGIGVVVLLNGFEKLFTFLAPIPNRKRSLERKPSALVDEEE